MSLEFTDSRVLAEYMRQHAGIVKPSIDRSMHLRWMIRRDMVEVLSAEQETWPAQSQWQVVDFQRTLKERNVIGMVADYQDAVAGFMVHELHRDTLDLINYAARTGCADAIEPLAEKLTAKISDGRRKCVRFDVEKTAVNGNQETQPAVQSNVVLFYDAIATLASCPQNSSTFIDRQQHLLAAMQQSNPKTPFVQALQQLAQPFIMTPYESGGHRMVTRRMAMLRDAIDPILKASEEVEEALDVASEGTQNWQQHTLNNYAPSERAMRDMGVSVKPYADGSSWQSISIMDEQRGWPVIAAATEHHLDRKDGFTLNNFIVSPLAQKKGASTALAIGLLAKVRESNWWKSAV